MAAEPMTEAERAALNEAILKTLEETQVEVVAGQILGDYTMKPLTRDGAQMIIDKLRARDFRIVREV
jgi:phosphoserine phosphatase